MIKLYSVSTCKKQVGPPAGFCSAFLLYSNNNCCRRINRLVLSWPNFQNPCAQCPWCRLFVSICSIKLWFKIYSHNNVLEWIKIIHLSSTRSWPNFPRPSCLWWRLYITFTISRDAMEESFSGLVMPISANYMVLYSRFSIFFYLSRKKICYFLVLSTLKKKIVGSTILLLHWTLLFILFYFLKCFFRCYPGPWKVLRKVGSKYICLHQQEVMPSLKEVALDILISAWDVWYKLFFVQVQFIIH